MKRLEFTPEEERLLVRSGDRALMQRMKRSAGIRIAFLALLISGAAVASANVWIVLALSLACLIVAGFEQYAYLRFSETAKNLIVKLSTRINELEK